MLVAQDADRFARGAGDAPGAADHLGELLLRDAPPGCRLWSVRSGELDLLRAAIEGERAPPTRRPQVAGGPGGLQRRPAKGKRVGEPALGYRLQRAIGDDGAVVSTRVIDAGG